MVSGRGRHYCSVTVALDDRGRAPVFVRCDLPEPSSCRHTVRYRTGGIENTVPYRAHHKAGFCYRGLVIFGCHGLFSRTIPAKSVPEGLIVAQGWSVLPGSRSLAARKKDPPGKAFRGSLLVDMVR